MTPQERAALVKNAKDASASGVFLETKWWLFDDVEQKVKEVSMMRQHMSDTLGSIIYDVNKPEYATIGLDCYNEIWKKLSHFGPHKVVTRIKGGNAAALQMCRLKSAQEAKALGFNFSDLDIDIMINPKLSEQEFDYIKGEVHKVLRQTLPTHKRRIDRAFFKPRTNDYENNWLIRDQNKSAFKTAVSEAVSSVSGAHSCFESVASRNRSSNISYLITPSNLDSEVDPSKKRILKIEQPILENAEKIPLAYSPVYVTVNDTIKTKKDDGSVLDFTLFRIKVGNHVMSDDCDHVRVNLRVVESQSPRYCSSPKSTLMSDDGSCSGSDTESLISLQIHQPYDKVSADLIDVCVGNRDDSELNDFWKRGGFNGLNFKGALTEQVTVFGNWTVWIPTLAECKNDYYKLLYVFDCPESKREKRERKYNALLNLL